MIFCRQACSLSQRRISEGIKANNARVSTFFLQTMIESKHGQKACRSELVFPFRNILILKLGFTLEPEMNLENVSQYPFYFAQLSTLYLYCCHEP